jgi:hypothetical protein
VQAHPAGDEEGADGEDDEHPERGLEAHRGEGDQEEESQQPEEDAGDHTDALAGVWPLRVGAGGAAPGAGVANRSTVAHRRTAP